MFEICALIIMATALAAFVLRSQPCRRRWWAEISKSLHSLPSYHGLYSALWTVIIGLFALVGMTILAECLG